jgi:hypothetical protein
VAERALALVDGRLAYDGPLAGLLQESVPSRRLVLPAAPPTPSGSLLNRASAARPIDATTARLTAGEVMP